MVARDAQIARRVPMMGNLATSMSCRATHPKWPGPVAMAALTGVVDDDRTYSQRIREMTSGMPISAWLPSASCSSISWSSPSASHGAAMSAPSLDHRRRQQQLRIFLYRNAQKSDVEDARDELHVPSRRSSLLHQKMLESRGPVSKKPSILPFILDPKLDPLRPISAISPSDFRSRLSLSSSRLFRRADTNEFYPRSQPSRSVCPRRSGMDRSVPTNGATVSHGHRTRNTLSGDTRSTNAGGTIEGEARSSLPPSQRIPTPPALPSRRGSLAVTARRASLPITPVSPSDHILSSRSSWGTHNTAMHPAVRPLPTPPTMPGSAASHMAPRTMSISPLSPVSPSTVARNTNYTRSATHKPPGMDTVPEDGDADASEYAETRSLHQLPSPPLSPDQPHVDARRRGSSVSSSRAGRQSAPSAPPSHRPRSSTGPSVALPLTAAFQTSVLRSGSGASASSSAPPSAFGHGQRHARLTSSSPPPRSRPSSVSMSSATGPPRPLPSPSPAPDTEQSMARPVTQAFRRMSTTDIRYRHPLSSSSRPGSPGMEGQSRVFMRPSDALRIPQASEATTSGTSSRPSSSHRHVVVHNPPPLPSIGLGTGGSVVPSSFATPPSLPLSPTSLPALSPAATPVAVSTGPQLSVHTHSHARTSGMGSAHPSAVNWKSLASGSRASLASASTQAPNAYPSVPRSRSNSVRSVRTLPVPPYLPALDSLSPLLMALEDTAEEDREDGNCRRGTP
ncbi:hypothetical protein LXA43DRAFT_225345 [Ganoderma leucocontextum]|nr:hypothetical protein LXA43DRAFT_225345 [Ganoderma leucocontextum]